MKIFIWLLVLLVLIGAAWRFGSALKCAYTWLSEKTPRMIEWWLIAIALCALISQLAPQQLPVSIYKISLIAIAGVVGYWLDRSLFPYARPDTFQAKDVEHDEIDDNDVLRFHLDVFPPNDVLFAVAMMRRALIVSAAMIAVGLGN